MLLPPQSYQELTLELSYKQKQCAVASSDIQILTATPPSHHVLRRP
jgi:hypothetical protein